MESSASGIPYLLNKFDSFILILLHGLNAIFDVGTPILQIFGGLMVSSSNTYLLQLNFNIFFQFIYWLGYVIPFTLFSGIVLIATFSVSKYYVNRKSRRFSKRIHRSIFQQLLHSSMATVNDSQVVKFFNALLENSSKCMYLHDVYLLIHIS